MGTNQRVSLHQRQIGEAREMIRMTQESLPPGAAAQQHLDVAHASLGRAIAMLKAEGR